MKTAVVFILKSIVYPAVKILGLLFVLGKDRRTDGQTKAEENMHWRTGASIVDSLPDRKNKKTDRWRANMQMNKLNQMNGTVFVHTTLQSCVGLYQLWCGCSGVNIIT